MIREEFAEYLKALREYLTGRYEDMRSTDCETDAEQWPQPDSEIEGIEQAQATSDGDEQEWMVSLR